MESVQPSSSILQETWQSIHDPLPVDARPVLLSGWFERQKFNALFLGFLVLVLGFIIFQMFASVALVLLHIPEMSSGADPQDLMAILFENPNKLFSANAIGQFVGLLMFTLLLARLHTSDVLGYLRIRKSDPLQLILAGIALFAAIPFVSFVAEFTQYIPLPDWAASWDTQQAEMLQQVLSGNISVPLALMLVAVTPAICEEVIFRGYFQRNMERSLSPIWAIVITGIAFGAFHLRFGELIPLALLGIFMAYVVWVSASIWPAVLAHFLNNGAAVIANAWATGRSEPIVLDEIAVPWYVGIGALLLCVLIFRAMYVRRIQLLVGTARQL